MWSGETAKSVSEHSCIGVLGGTFDPIHCAHLAIAEAARCQVGLDQVLFVVSAVPPHKRGDVHAPAQDRLDLTRAAVADIPGFEACDLELRRSGPSYTVDTLRELRALYPHAELFLIMGYDAALDLPNWRDPHTILNLARLLILPRPNDSYPPLHPHIAARAQILAFNPMNLSSTEIRDALRRGEPPREALPEAVLDLIRHKGLYGCR